MLLRNVAGRLGGADVVRVLNDMARAQARDAEELGEDTLRELRRQQANGLLGAAFPGADGAFGYLAFPFGAFADEQTPPPSR